VELFYSPELAVMEDDVAGWIGHVLEGADVDEATMAVDVINQVGPIPGHYLGTAHTREWWQQDNYFLKVTDNDSYSSWLKSGKGDMLSRARDRVEEILETHEPLPLTAQQEQAIEDVLAEARRFYRDQKLISDEEWSEYMRVL
jgi:trimethylamine--corrinoid protein Co-methyltransferase